MKARNQQIGKPTTVVLSSQCVLSICSCTGCLNMGPFWSFQIHINHKLSEGFGTISKVQLPVRTKNSGPLQEAMPCASCEPSSALRPALGNRRLTVRSLGVAQPSSSLHCLLVPWREEPGTERPLADPGEAER